MSEVCSYLCSYHRLIWVGRDIKAHPVPSPYLRAGHLPLDQVAPTSAVTIEHSQQPTSKEVYLLKIMSLSQISKHLRFGCTIGASVKLPSHASLSGYACGV